jgi:hypothetical protein
LIIFTRAKIEQETINEAEVGRFEYGGMEGTTLILDGELLVSIDEVKQLDSEFGVEKPELPVDEPFQKWEDLIAAVAQRTPEAKKIRRYLEDFGYQDILKMRNERTLPDGSSQVRWENFLLPTDIAHQAGAADGADYNRRQFKRLQKHAPRTMEPEVFGGRKLMRGAVGSQREMRKRREPVVDKLVAEGKDEVLHELRVIFGVLPEEWTDAFLGPNNNNITYIKDPRAIHLGKQIDVVKSTADYQEIERWNRVLAMLNARSASGDKEAYQDAVKEVQTKIGEIEEAGTGKYELVFVNVAIPLRAFYAKLLAEFKATDYRGIDGHFVVNTSLSSKNDLVSLLDPSKTYSGEIMGKSQPTTKTTFGGGRFGFNKDLNGIILEALKRAYGGSIKNIIRMDNDGNIFFSVHEEPEGEPEADIEIDPTKRARVTRAVRRKMKQSYEEPEDEEDSGWLDDILSGMQKE